MEIAILDKHGGMKGRIMLDMQTEARGPEPAHTSMDTGSHPDPEPLGQSTRNNLKALRKRAGLTQVQLAERIGATQPDIARLEGGALSLGEHWVHKLCDFFGVSADELMGRKPVQAEPRDNTLTLVKHEKAPFAMFRTKDDRWFVSRLELDGAYHEVAECESEEWARAIRNLLIAEEDEE